jgi:hypothetical protein
MDTSVIKVLSNPLPLNEIQEYTRRLQQLSTRVFAVIEEGDINLRDNDLSPLVSSRDVTSVVMNALGTIFSLRDYNLARSYYHQGHQ